MTPGRQYLAIKAAMSSTTFGATLPCFCMYSSGVMTPSPAKKRWLSFG